MEQIKIDTIESKCPNSKVAKLTCCNPKCQKSAFTCYDQSCSCRNDHRRCHHLQLEQLVQQVIDAKKNIPDEAKNSFTLIGEIIKKLKVQLQAIQEELKKAIVNFGLRKFEQQFFDMVRKPESQSQIKGVLISKLELEIQKGEKPKINKDQDIKTSWIYYESHFKKACEQLRKYFKIINGGKNLTVVVDNQSKITNEYAQLEQWIAPSINKIPTQFKLLYRASQNNFKIAQFHAKCAGVANTLVLIQTQFDKVIGGFNPFAWGTPGNGAWYNDTSKRTFIFSLSMKEKMFNYNNNGNSFYYNTANGPYFGNGPDLYISEDANTSGSSNGAFLSTFQNGLRSRNQDAYKLFSGQTNGSTFKVKEWEVYQVI